MVKSLEVRNQEAIAKANKLYERLNSIWTGIEDTLKSKTILAPVEFNYLTEFQTNHWIGIQKLSSKWRICYATSPSDTSKKTWTAVVDNSLEIRLELLKQVPFLEEELVKSNEAAVKYLEKSMLEVEEFASKFFKEN